MKVLRPTDTDSLLCMRVKIPSTRPISASFAGTSEPIRAIKTIRPTCQRRLSYKSYWITTARCELNQEREKGGLTSVIHNSSLGMDGRDKEDSHQSQVSGQQTI